MNSDPNGQDKELARRAAQGDEDAWRQLYEANCQQLFNFLCYQVGDREAARDLLQESFLTALKILDRYRGDGSLLSWLRSIALHKALDWKRGLFRKLRKLQELAAETPQPEWIFVPRGSLPREFASTPALAPSYSACTRSHAAWSMARFSNRRLVRWYSTSTADNLTLAALIPILAWRTRRLMSWGRSRNSKVPFLTASPSSTGSLAMTPDMFGPPAADRMGNVVPVVSPVFAVT